MTTQTEIKAQRKTELPEGWENYSIYKEKIPDTPFWLLKYHCLNNYKVGIVIQARILKAFFFKFRCLIF